MRMTLQRIMTVCDLYKATSFEAVAEKHREAVGALGTNTTLGVL